jgi:hypothetical protein
MHHSDPPQMWPNCWSGQFSWSYFSVHCKHSSHASPYHLCMTFNILKLVGGYSLKGIDNQFATPPPPPPFELSNRSSFFHIIIQKLYIEQPMLMQAYAFKLPTIGKAAPLMVLASVHSCACLLHLHCRWKCHYCRGVSILIICFCLVNNQLIFYTSSLSTFPCLVCWFPLTYTPAIESLIPRPWQIIMIAQRHKTFL